MSPAYRMLLATSLSAYPIVSPFLFLWFHKRVLNQVWDDDLTDSVTVRLWIMSNIAVCYMAYVFEECGKCG